MAAFTQRLRNKFGQLAQEQEQLVAKAEALRDDFSPAAEDWQDLCEHVTKETLPAIDDLKQQAQDASQPPDLRELHEAIQNLKRLPRITWWHGRSALIRFKNFIYRCGIFTVRMVQLAIILGILYLIMRVIWLLV